MSKRLMNAKSQSNRKENPKCTGTLNPCKLTTGSCRQLDTHYRCLTRSTSWTLKNKMENQFIKTLMMTVIAVIDITLKKTSVFSWRFTQNQGFNLDQISKVLHSTCSFETNRTESSKHSDVNIIVSLCVGFTDDLVWVWHWTELNTSIRQTCSLLM